MSYYKSHKSVTTLWIVVNFVPSEYAYENRVLLMPPMSMRLETKACTTLYQNIYVVIIDFQLKGLHVKAK